MAAVSYAAGSGWASPARSRAIRCETSREVRWSAGWLDYAYFVDAAAGEVDAAVGGGGHVAHGAAA